jgi:hypothetical protein
MSPSRNEYRTANPSLSVLTMALLSKHRELLRYGRLFERQRFLHFVNRSATVDQYFENADSGPKLRWRFVECN